MSDIRIDNIDDVKKLFHGEHESQTRVQIAVPERKDTTYYAVGERWIDDDGNEWEQKDGYKMKLGKAWQQELHSYLKEFPNCSKETCTCQFPKKLDERMRTIHGMCFDCVVAMEHKIKIAGQWDDYESGKIKANAFAWLKEAEADKDLIASELSKAEFTNDFGDLEKWDVGTTKEQILEKIEEEFIKFKTEIIASLDGVEKEHSEKDIEGKFSNTGDA